MDVKNLVEVNLKHSENFLKVAETLTRIGVASQTGNRLFQSCHILHKRGKYYVTHFKEMFALDGRSTDLTEEDIGRRNTIVRLLVDWGLISVVESSKIQEPVASMNRIKVVKYSDKGNWELIPKYNIGRGREAP